MPLGFFHAIRGHNLFFFHRKGGKGKKENIEQRMNYFADEYQNILKLKDRLLIFPEGHRLAERNLQRLRFIIFLYIYIMYI